MSLSRWQGRVAVVTGASAGIGASIAVELCKNGIITVAVARRVERIAALKDNLTAEEQKLFHPMKCDVSIEADIVRIFAEVERKFGGVDILINNAAILPQKNLIEINNSEDVQRVMNTNVMSVVNCTREAVNSLKARNADGHIIHINSIAGHSMPYSAETNGYGMYVASKYAVTALAEQHRQEFIKQKLNIKVTSLSPGAVRTEIMTANAGSIPLEMIEKMMAEVPFLESKDIADAVIYLLSTPPNVLVTEFTIRPMNETF